ncbi:pseudouridine synthase [Clostridia bacterium]|nr:pseudouridine synthase [Clostridia bacterium]
MLVHAGFCSRSQARELVARNRVELRGSALFVDGVDADWQEHYWIMLNKPRGVVCSTDDPLSGTVLNLLDVRYRRMGLFPVGRLDKDSTGLVLLTEDGAAAHRITSPKNHCEKRYFVRVEGAIGRREVDAFAAGMELADKKVMKTAQLEVCEDASCCYVTLTEGKYHQIKRMFGVLGLPVVELTRMSIGGIKLDQNLPEGGWRRLTEGEIRDFCGNCTG